MRDNEMTVIIWLITIGIALSLFGGCWVIRSKLEADAFRRVTGREVSTWDAMFLDLRVLEPAQPEKKSS